MPDDDGAILFGLEQFEKYDINAWISSASRLREMIAHLDRNAIDRVDGLEFITSSGSPIGVRPESFVGVARNGPQPM